MDTKRARQIMQSRGVIEVLYNGSSVWIENVRNDNVDVSDLTTHKRMEVPAAQLTEGNTVMP